MIAATTTAKLPAAVRQFTAGVARAMMKIARTAAGRDRGAVTARTQKAHAGLARNGLGPGARVERNSCGRSLGRRRAMATLLRLMSPRLKKRKKRYVFPYFYTLCTNFNFDTEYCAQQK